MPSKSREELIKELENLGWLGEKEREFYNLSHDEKANPEIFEKFCEATAGYYGLLLSDEEVCDNKKLVLIAKKHGFWKDIHLLSERLRNDPEMALVLADCDHHEYFKIGKALRDDLELMLKAIQINTSIYRHLPVKVRVNKKIILEIANKDPYQLQHLLKVRKEYRDSVFGDKEIALIVAEKDPRVLFEYFDSRVTQDKDVLEKAFRISNPVECRKVLRKYPWGIQFVNQNYWEDDEILVKKALREKGELLEFLPPQYKQNKDYVLLAVKSNPLALQYSPEEFRDDREVIMAALQPDSEEVLSFASERLRSDYSVVMKAVRVDALNLQYASDKLRDNREIVLRAIKTYGGVLEDASERLQSDEELIMIAENNM